MVAIDDERWTARQPLGVAACATRAEAERVIIERGNSVEAESYIAQHTADLPSELTRSNYEARCAAAGITPLSDETHHQFGIAFYPQNRAERVILAKLTTVRMNSLKRERQAARAAEIAANPPAPVEMFICSGCGQEHPRAIAMNANLGISCPGCYDDLSG